MVFTVLSLQIAVVLEGELSRGRDLIQEIIYFVN